MDLDCLTFMTHLEHAMMDVGINVSCQELARPRLSSDCVGFVGSLSMRVRCDATSKSMDVHPYSTFLILRSLTIDPLNPSTNLASLVSVFAACQF